MLSGMPQLFVYGSLKRGFSNAHWLDGQEFLAEVRTAPGYRMLDYGGFPALVLGTDSIKGELYEVGEDCLERLDILEGVAERLYERTTVRLEADAPFDVVVGYLYLREVEGLPAVGEEWHLRLDGG